MKTNEIYFGTIENCEVVVNDIKVEDTSFYGTDITVNFDLLDKKSGYKYVEGCNMTFDHGYIGMNEDSEVENFFEDNDIDGDEYGWEIEPDSDIAEDYKEYIINVAQDCVNEDEYIWEDVKEMILENFTFNFDIIFINGEAVEFNRKNIKKIYNMDIEGTIYKYKNIYFDVLYKNNIQEYERIDSSAYVVTARDHDNFCYVNANVGQTIYSYEQIA